MRDALCRENAMKPLNEAFFDLAYAYERYVSVGWIIVSLSDKYWVDECVSQSLDNTRLHTTTAASMTSGHMKMEEMMQLWIEGLPTLILHVRCALQFLVRQHFIFYFLSVVNMFSSFIICLERMRLHPQMHMLNVFFLAEERGARQRRKHARDDHLLSFPPFPSVSHGAALVTWLLAKPFLFSSCVHRNIFTVYAATSSSFISGQTATQFFILSSQCSNSYVIRWTASLSPTRKYVRANQITQSVFCNSLSS